jgi:hypothetical protein
VEPGELSEERQRLLERALAQRGQQLVLAAGVAQGVVERADRDAGGDGARAVRVALAGA